MKKEFQILLTALMFYTRLNVARWVKHDQSNLQNSTKYLPFVGWLVGACAALAYLGTIQLLPFHVAVILSLLVSVLITGAFHEDGLADVCDGFGGGWDKVKIMSIMKDSSIGTYGAIGLIILFSLKIGLLLDIYSKLPSLSILLVTMTGHTLSRFIATTFLFTHQYARTSPDSKAKDLILATKKSILLVGGVFGLLPLFALSYCLHNYLVLLLIFPCYLIKYLLGRYFVKWVDGYTGDCLGATQQITEIIFYLSFTGLWKFI